MRILILTLLLGLLALGGARAPRHAAADEGVSPRAPFSLEIPELGGPPITAPSVRIPTADLRALRFRVRAPFADSINYGNIYTTINGEAANTIQDIKAGRDGKIVTCNLEMKERFRLRPGKNVVEISATDRDRRSFYASYVLIAGSTGAASAGQGATFESFPAASGADREPPEIQLAEPKGAVRLQRAAEAVRVRGTATDDAGKIESVKVNGRAVVSKAGAGGASFETTVSVGSAEEIVVEAQDAAGNLSRLRVPVVRRVAAVSSRFTGRKFAVVIGVSKYKFQDGGLKDLEYADADARAVRDFLQRREGGGFSPSDILYLENQEATSESVRAALTRFLPRAQKGDLIFLYVASHGAPDPYAPQNLYLLLHDTKVADMPGTAFSMSELQNLLDNHVRADRVVVLIDACHSAGLSGKKLVTARELEHTENNVFNLYAAKLFKEAGRAVLTSSDVNEVSQEGSGWGGGHGVFTWALLEGLRGESDVNNDKLVTAGELFDFVSERVRVETKFRQNPQALAGLNRDLALAAVSGERAAARAQSAGPASPRERAHAGNTSSKRDALR